MPNRNLLLRRLSACLLTACFAAVSPAATEAQFFKKLGKALDKAGNFLDKTNDALGGKSSRQAAKSDKSGNKSSAQKSDAIDDSRWKKADPEYNHPFITPQTRFMQVDGYNLNFSDVHEGIFAVKEEQKYSFWKIGGAKLFDADWEYCGEDSYGDVYPEFSGGVAAARRATANAAGKKPISLLYADGSVRELPPSYTNVTRFMDGIALVTQKVKYDELYFYINAQGTKVFPNLTIRGGERKAMRPLRDGLRAVPLKIGYKYGWGFIDVAGKIVIQPDYYEARDFSEGYAWVKKDVSGKPMLIDKTGKVVFESPRNLNLDYVSDVVDGRFYLSHSQKIWYYNTEGQELASFSNGNCFYGGYAYVLPVDRAVFDISSTIVDRDFNVVKRVSDKVVSASVVCEGGPVFEPYGLATIRNADLIVTPLADVVLAGFDDLKGTRIEGFEQLSADGYARVKNITFKHKEYTGLMRADGFVAWLFSRDAANGNLPDDLPPEIRKPIIDDPIVDPEPEPEPQPTPPTPVPPVKLIIVDRVKEKAIGPKTVTPVKFNVRVSADPGEGGTVSLTPAGTFGYGDYATVTASPNEDWGIVSITTDNADAAVKAQLGKPFAVTSDMDITVHFVKKEKTSEPEMTGAYQGEVVLTDDGTSLKVPVYAEISRDATTKTPYGDNTHGFVALMFDPDRRYVFPNFSTNFFAAPLNIVGVQHDEATGKQWLVAEGGNVTLGNLKVNPEGNNLFGMWFSLCATVSGFSSPSTQPRLYRIEMRDVNKDTGEFTFGALEAYSPKGRWVPGGSKEMGITSKGLMMAFTDKGLPSDTFAGAVMKAAKKRTDVHWYPTASWFDGKESVFQQIISAMNNTYRTFTTDYDNIIGK